MLEKFRNVDDVIFELLLIIPKSEVILINEITKYQQTLWNKAPELQNSAYCWIPLQKILNYYIPIIDEEWKIQLAKKFNGTK